MVITDALFLFEKDRHNCRMWLTTLKLILENTILFKLCKFLACLGCFLWEILYAQLKLILFNKCIICPNLNSGCGCFTIIDGHKSTNKLWSYEMNKSWNVTIVINLKVITYCCPLSVKLEGIYRNGPVGSSVRLFITLEVSTHLEPNFWFPTVFWPLVGKTVSTHLQTPTDWMEINFGGWINYWMPQAWSCMPTNSQPLIKSPRVTRGLIVFGPFRRRCLSRCRHSANTFQLSGKIPEANLFKPHMVDLWVWEKILAPISVTLGQGR